MKKPNPKKVSATVLSLILFATNGILAHAAEANFWTNRQDKIELASLPKPTLPAPLPTHISEKRIQKWIKKKESESLKQVLKSLPAQHGSIRHVAVPEEGSSKKIVLHIQDVHMNQEAQRNIGAAVEELIKQDKVDLVALEGAFGPLNIPSYRQVPDRTSVGRVADYLLKENKISGPVHSAFTLRLRSGQALPLFVGVDDPTHYNANVDAVRMAFPYKDVKKEELIQLKRDLEFQKQKVFNPLLRDFDLKITAYREGAIEIGDYAAHLASSRKDVSITVETFLEALALETSLDFSRVEQERTLLLHQLLKKIDGRQTSELMDLSVAFRLGRLGHMDFYQHLKEVCERNGVDLSRFPNLNDYFQYVLLSDSISVEALNSDLRKLETSIYKDLTQTHAEDVLIETSRWTHLLGKLIDFGLTSNEWEEYTLLRREREGKEGNKDEMSHFENFYEEAILRDEKISGNLVSALKSEETQVAILVTGGFHAQGIHERLKNEKITVISWVPKLTHLRQGYGGQAHSYLSVFAQEKTPLGELLEGEKLFLASQPIVSLSSFNKLTILSRLARSGRAVKRFGEAIWHMITHKKTGEILKVWVVPAKRTWTLPEWLYSITFAGFVERNEIWEPDFNESHPIAYIKELTGFDEDKIMQQLEQNQKILIGLIKTTQPVLAVLLSFPFVLGLTQFEIPLLLSVVLSLGLGWASSYFLTHELINPLYHDAINGYRLLTGGVVSAKHPNKRQQKKVEKRKRKKEEQRKERRREAASTPSGQGNEELTKQSQGLEKLRQLEERLGSENFTMDELREILSEASVLIETGGLTEFALIVKQIESMLKFEASQAGEGEEPASSPTNILKDHLSQSLNVPLGTHDPTETPVVDRKIWTEATRVSVNYLRESRRTFFRALEAIFSDKIIPRLKPHLDSPRDILDILEVGAGGGMNFELSVQGLRELFLRQAISSWLQTDRFKEFLDLPSTQDRRTQVVDILRELPFGEGSRRAITTLSALDTIFLDQLPGVLKRLTRVLADGSPLIHILDVIPQWEVQQQRAYDQNLEIFPTVVEIMPGIPRVMGYLLVDWNKIVERYPDYEKDELFLLANEFRFNPIAYLFEATRNESMAWKLDEMSKHIRSLARRFEAFDSEGDSIGMLQINQLKEAAPEAGLTVLEAGEVRSQFIFERRDLPGLDPQANMVRYQSSLFAEGYDPNLKNSLPSYEDPVFVDISVHLFHAVKGDPSGPARNMALGLKADEASLIPTTYADVADKDDRNAADMIEGLIEPFNALLPLPIRGSIDKPYIQHWIDEAKKGEQDLRSALDEFRKAVVNSLIGYQADQLDDAIAEIIERLVIYVGPNRSEGSRPINPEPKSIPLTAMITASYMILAILLAASGLVWMALLPALFGLGSLLEMGVIIFGYFNSGTYELIEAFKGRAPPSRPWHVAENVKGKIVSANSKILTGLPPALQSYIAKREQLGLQGVSFFGDIVVHLIIDPILLLFVLITQQPFEASRGDSSALTVPTGTQQNGQEMTVLNSKNQSLDDVLEELRASGKLSDSIPDPRTWEEDAMSGELAGMTNAELGGYLRGLLSGDHPVIESMGHLAEQHSDDYSLLVAFVDTLSSVIELIHHFRSAPSRVKMNQNAKEMEIGMGALTTEREQMHDAIIKGAKRYQAFIRELAMRWRHNPQQDQGGDILLPVTQETARQTFSTILNDYRTWFLNSQPELRELAQSKLNFASVHDMLAAFNKDSSLAPIRESMETDWDEMDETPSGVLYLRVFVDQIIGDMKDRRKDENLRSAILKKYRESGFKDEALEEALWWGLNDEIRNVLTPIAVEKRKPVLKQHGEEFIASLQMPSSPTFQSVLRNVERKIQEFRQYEWSHISTRLTQQGQINIGRDRILDMLREHSVNPREIDFFSKGFAQLSPDQQQVVVEKLINSPLSQPKWWEDLSHRRQEFMEFFGLHDFLKDEVLHEDPGVLPPEVIYLKLIKLGRGLDEFHSPLLLFGLVFSGDLIVFVLVSAWMVFLWWKHKRESIESSVSATPYPHSQVDRIEKNIRGRTANLGVRKAISRFVDIKDEQRLAPKINLKTYRRVLTNA